MILKTTAKWCMIFILMATAFSIPALAQTEKMQASIFLLDIKEPIVVREFTINSEPSYDALQQGKPVKLLFQDLKEIKFLKPGISNEVEVLFKDDRKEMLQLKPASDITIVSGTGVVSISHTKVGRIAFSPVPAEPPRPVALPGPQTPRPGVQTGTFDRVFLKSGDILSGNIQTLVFPVRTAYGTIPLEMPKIASIEFDEKGPNTAVVMLRSGDRISGTVEVDPVLFVITSGQGISFDSKTIKSIQFKR